MTMTRPEGDIPRDLSDEVTESVESTAPQEDSIIILGEGFEGELNDAFQRLQIGIVGLPTADRTRLVTARDVVQAYRDFATKTDSELSEEDALGRLLSINEIPVDEAVKIGILWARSFPQPEISPTERFIASPLDIRRKEAPAGFDLNIRRRPGIFDRINMHLHRRTPPPR